VNAVFCATAGQTFSLVLVGIPEGKWLLWIPRHRWDNNKKKTCFKIKVCEANECRSQWPRCLMHELC
jgi:hypothetical protein